MTRTYYDKTLPLLTIPNFSQSHLRLRVASTCFYEEEYAQSNPNEYEYDHATHYSYDIHGNVKTLVQDHPQLGLDADVIEVGCIGCIDHRYKRLDYTYDLISGNVKQVRYQADQPDEFDHAYTYDADNRITEVRTSADGENWHTDAKYFYYAHGPLQRVELGDHIVQGTDYAYTLQGWLKGVNSDRLHPTTDMGHDGDIADTDPANDLIGRDAFGFSLGYYGDMDYAAISTDWDNLPGERAFAPIGSSGTLFNEHRPLYNGNIAHTTYTLQPFGLWDSGNGAQGQVLAQVYKYDQLNRLRTAQGVTGLTTTNSWEGVNDPAPDRYRSEYTYDANGNILTADRYDQDENHYDEFSYLYEERDGRLVRNRLYQLNDVADQNNDYVNEPTGATDIAWTGTLPFDPEDPDINNDYNYRYDQLGNLVHDAREEINEINWTVAGKVRSVSRTPGSTREPLTFAYGASGQRTQKQVGDPDGTTPTGYREHYIRDAQGNIMATYRFTNNGPASLELQDRPMYGSSRLGTYGEPKELRSLMSWDPADPALMAPVRLNYELTDHLGNVAAVVTGRLLDGNGSGAPKQAELVSAQGYEPFGSLLPGRNYSSSEYRFGFNTQEKDDEIYGATGTSYTAEYWQYDPRLGRRWNVDPVIKPHESPYSTFASSPLWLVDPNGADTVEMHVGSGEFRSHTKAKGNDVFFMVNDDGQRLDGKSISFDEGTLRAVRRPKVRTKDREGESIEIAITMFEINGDDNAKELFEFLANPDNTGVEWTHARIGKSDSGRNVVGSGHQSTATPVGAYLRQTGYTLREVNHNHPQGVAFPSRGDRTAAELYHGRNASTLLQIYTHPDNYVQYGQFGLIHRLREIEITPSTDDDAD